MYKRIALAFGPIVGFIALLYLFKPAETPEAAEVPRAAASEIRHTDDKLVLAGNREETTLRCEPGSKVVISGNDNEVKLEGRCGAVAITGQRNEIDIEEGRKLAISGNRNEIEIDRTGPIAITGNRNVVEYEEGIDGQTPSVTRLGNRNEVKRN